MVIRVLSSVLANSARRFPAHKMAKAEGLGTFSTNQKAHAVGWSKPTMMNLPLHIRKQSQQTDLLTFSSWDFSSQAHDDEFSIDSNSLLTSNVSIDEQEQTVQYHPLKSVDVHVGGKMYRLDPITFKKIGQLPWRYQQQAVGSSTCGYSLDTSPELFEQLVSFIESGSLPLLNKISTSDKEELELLAAILNLGALQDHLNRKGRPLAPTSFRFHRDQSNKTQRSGSSSSLSSSSASASNAQQQQLQQQQTSVITRVKRKTGQLLRRQSSSTEPRRMSHSEMSALSDRFQ